MAPIEFIDQIKIFVRAGNGGAGSRHYHREKFVPKGGPDGGDGGKGGHIILEGNQHLTTLLDFRYRKHIIAPHGQPGEANHRKGANGQNVILPVPLGTVIREEETIKGEITQHKEQYIIAQGGQGGRGNVHFKSATKQAPQYAQPGKLGERLTLTLELKLIANIGLVGNPNAGKSTLLSVISAAKPKIANYPFTTLVPHLGVVAYQKQKTFIVADIPGLIAGAAKGKGLGTRFLRHIERTQALLFMVPINDDDILASYQMLCQEIEEHNPDLLNKPHLLAITKIDLFSPADQAELLQDIPATLPYLAISSLEGTGIQALKRNLWELTQKGIARKK